LQIYLSASFRLIGVLLAAASASGQSRTSGTAQDPVFTIDVVFTESKIPQQQKNITQKVSVLDTRAIDIVTENRNLAELLQFQPGSAVTVLSRNDANWGSYGGLGPKYNSYLLDGLPVDGFVDTMSLDPWALARVETHRGPASVLYSNYLSMDFAGNQAPLAGITNLILKDRIDHPLTRFMIAGGSWNTLNGRFYHQDHKGRVHFFLGTSYEQSDYTNYGSPDSWLNILESPSYRKTKVYGKATYYLGRDGHQLSFFAQRTMHDGVAGRPNRDYGHTYDTLNASYSNEVSERLTVQLRTGLRNYDRRWGEDNYPASLLLREHDGVEQKIFPSDLTLNVRHAGESVFTMGVDSQYAWYRTYAEAFPPPTYANEATALSVGAFLQEKYVAGDWVLRAGVRLSRTRNSFNLISGVVPVLRSQTWNRSLWSAGVRYNVSRRLSVYSNAGTSFIPPASKSVAGTLAPADRGVVGKDGQLPNASLRPESGIGMDAGADVRFAERAVIGARLFFSRINDAIVENVVSTSPSQSMSVNAGNARSWGVEIPYEQDLSDSVQVFANFTRNYTRVANRLDRDQDRATITFVPGYVANAGAHFKLPQSLTLSPYLHSVGVYYDSTSLSGRREFGPYQVVNVRVEKTLSRSDGYSTILFADLNNLTDRRFELPWQFRDPGFNVFGGLDFRF
jgi:iron complex outermembrane receptor protein